MAIKSEHFADYKFILYSCTNCGELLGQIDDDKAESENGFEFWKFCPFCGELL